MYSTVGSLASPRSGLRRGASFDAIIRFQTTNNKAVNLILGLCHKR